MPFIPILHPRHDRCIERAGVGSGGEGAHGDGFGFERHVAEPEQEDDADEAQAGGEAEEEEVRIAFGAEGGEDRAADERAADHGGGVGEVEGGEHAGAFLFFDVIEEEEERAEFVHRPDGAGENLHEHEPRERVGNDPQTCEWDDAEAGGVEERLRAESSRERADEGQDGHLCAERHGDEQQVFHIREVELLEHERRELREGHWLAVVGGRFDVNAIQRFRWEDVSADLPGIRMPDNRFINLARLRRIITVDPASSEKETADFTVISAWAIGENGELFWLGCDRGRWDLTKIVPRIQRMTSIWQPHEVGIEAVMANNAVYKLARRTAMPVRKLSPTGPFGKNADKLVRALPAMTYMEDGRIWLPQGDPLFPYDDVLDELRRFTGDPDQDAHDDVVDTLSYAIMRLQNLDTHTGRAPSTAGAFAKGRESDESVLSGIEDAEEPKRAKQHKRNSAPRVMRRLR